MIRWGMRTEDLSDEHLNQIGRFLGLPPSTAEEHARLRAYCRWKRSRFAPETVRPDPPASSDSPTKQWMESSKKRGTDPSSRDLIYGDAPNGGLVFMERCKAFENIAFRAAVTWGDFRKGAPTLYERALADLGAEENPPPDTQELDHEALDGDGDFHYFPEQLMLDFIPKLVQERYGRVEETAFNGPMLILDSDHESKIVAALRDRGFSVLRHDALMEALYA
jgi:hypothetical protein